MNRTISLIIALTLLFSVFSFPASAAKEEHVFRNGIKWGASEKEILAAEAELTGTASFFDESETLKDIEFFIPSFSVFTDVGLDYILSDDQLVAVMYRIMQYSYEQESVSEDEIRYLIAAMTSKYGEGRQAYLMDIFRALQPLTGISKNDLAGFTPYRCWKLPDGTNAILFKISEIALTLMYLSPDFIDLDFVSGDL